VLLADEVTSEVDAADRQKVIDLLRGVFATRGPEAAAACDHELHLSDGAAMLLR
jgi:putative ABC transport system ATP-binding protein